MRNQKLKEWQISLLIAVAGMVVLAGIVLTMSHFEARAYNRLCGTDVSTMDAVFLSLRVEGNCRGGQ